MAHEASGMNRELTAFIEHARQKGMDHATIRLLLLSAGWKEKEIVQALAETTLEMPIPAPPDTGGARDAAFHLLTFTAFYTLVIGVVMLLFRYINHLFPDPAMGEVGRAERWDLSSIRWSLALVIVAFPTFLGLTRFLLREMRAHPERSWSGVRRWLTYLTLVVASVVLGGDMITLVFRLLEGELSTRFLLKVVVVLLVAGLSFAYYLLSLRIPVESREARRLHRGFAVVATLLTLFTLGWGFVLVGSPATERQRKFDERRIEDLGAIRDEIANIVLGDLRHLPPEERKQQRPLPRTLQEVVSAAKERRPEIVDPRTGEPYVYDVLDDTRFRLCAVFQFERNESYDVLWNHPSGRHCFEFDVMHADVPMKNLTVPSARLSLPD